MEPTHYALPAANDVVDGLLEMVRDGLVVPLRLGGRIRFCTRDNMKPEYEAHVVDYATTVAELERYAAKAMAVWN